jgi:hypothetical protein
MTTIITTISELELKVKELKQIKIDAENWQTYYLDEKTSEKWVKDYPNSSYHGGGAPTLTMIKKFPWE